ncbi:ankyrin repeat protein [Dactylonectria estremocensis]|uniref:Ankyrin repeat protein n=1 Tax=Dactylonectria estremocensis TaxID=1079267 RepID=A0A9P9EHH4_9HYPO|nr:ankyrin repeat protein [Dactylonectria estremocensis]
MEDKSEKDKASVRSRKQDQSADTGSVTSNDEASESDSFKTTSTDDLFAAFAPQSPLDPGLTTRELGLSINRPHGWSGSAYDDYDVVTVHGLRDDRNSAWIDEKDKWWVKTHLFASKEVRVVDYAYAIDEDSTIYRPDGIRFHAQRLAAEYARLREKLEDTETDRPVIWVCHDLGGTIVKETLLLASASPKTYGKIAILTTAIVFLGTPHRAHSTVSLENQLHNLILLPGPAIRSEVLKKVKDLAHQVNRVNQEFPATKHLVRTNIFNIFADDRTLKTRKIQKDTSTQNGDGTLTQPEVGARDGDGGVPGPVPPFLQFTHRSDQPLEAAMALRWGGANHLDLVRGDTSQWWIGIVSNMLNKNGCYININYNTIQEQGRLLSLSPPTRSLDTPFDVMMPRHPVVSWIYDQEAYKQLSKLPTSPRLLHVHANGNHSLDIAKLSRLFYLDYDRVVATRNDGRQRVPEASVAYFEFDEKDSRYNNISSMLLYFINIIAWHFCDPRSASINNIPVELEFMSDTRSCSLDDLYHLYSALRIIEPRSQMTLFISCFDQCPADQRNWFLGRILHEQSYGDRDFRLILSTCSRDGLAVDSFPSDSGINLEECPTLDKTIINDPQTMILRAALDSLVAKRPMYEDFGLQLDDLLVGYSHAPHLAHAVLCWLEHYSRGRPRSKIANTISQLSSVTTEDMVHVFIDFLPAEDQPRARNCFNWIKHAAEPWTPESLAEALAVHDCSEEEPTFDDLDPVELVTWIERAFGGLITVRGRDFKFCHSSLYGLPEMGIAGSAEDRAAKVHSSIAETCLRYFWLKGAQYKLAMLSLEELDGGCWTELQDAAFIAHQRTSMAEYAVRFWPQHYRSSGRFKPSNLVRELFASKEARAAWEVPFYTLSNPFTRIHQSYLSPLPVYAMLGLEDLVEEQCSSEIGKPLLNKNCWYAITEAARAGSKELVEKLLEQVTLDEEKLANALFWAAAYGKGGAIDVLVDKIPDAKTFPWPDNILYRAVASGLDSLLAVLLRSGCDVNKTSKYWGAPAVVIAAWRQQVSSMKLLLDSEPKPDLTVRDDDGDIAILVAVRSGNPDMVDLLLRSGASVDKPKDQKAGLVNIAVERNRHKAVGVLINGKADFESGTQSKEAPSLSRPPLVLAADRGLRECVEVLLAQGANPNVACDGGTALYCAVAGNHIDIVRRLLENDPKADVNVQPVDEDMLMIRAVCTGNTELVSLLMEHGAEINFADPRGEFSKTPLARATNEGDINMVRFLLDNGADINFNGDDPDSDPPLFTAAYRGKLDIAKLLLEKNCQVIWTAGDGWNALHAAYDIPELFPELVKRGIDIDSHSAHGTVLHMAAEGEPTSIAALLAIDPGPTVDLVVNDESTLPHLVGLTALQISCLSLAPRSLKLLLDGGANARFRNKHGDDAASILLRTAASSAEEVEKAEKCMKLLLSTPNGIEVHYADKDGSTLLHKVEKLTPVAVVKLLVEEKAPLDEPNDDKYTPLAMAVSKGNEAVAKYLIEQGASVNVFGPRFGSILHLACSKDFLSTVKLLISSGADPDVVDAEYGESLLYTALGIASDSSSAQMVRYLVDEAKVNINKPGGKLAYPIIRAAAALRSSDPKLHVAVFRFLIQRKASLEVSDHQGRRAVHFAAMARKNHGIRALAEAGADLSVKDKFGRMPIHFAVTGDWPYCLRYLLGKMDKAEVDVDVEDGDGWTPLIWAARSGSSITIKDLLNRQANLWTRGRGYGSKPEWSALKLTRFRGAKEAMVPLLTPKEITGIKPNGEKEQWDDRLHRSKVGHKKEANCWSCCVPIIGIQWKCIECSDDVSLCFKCYGSRSDMHDPDHNFEEIGPLYEEAISSLHSEPDGSSSSKGEQAGFEEPGGDEGDATHSDEAEVPIGEDSDDEFDPDSFDPDAVD